MSSSSNAGFENCPEISCKSPEESRAVHNIIFTHLMYTPSGPAYKFMADWLAAQGGSDSDFYHDSHHFTVNRQMQMYFWFGPATALISS